MFQSTPPSREATTSTPSLSTVCSVSIHAPLTGGDDTRSCVPAQSTRFNPRPPHGRRRGGEGEDQDDHQFQSTPPSREATRVRIFPTPRRSSFNPRPPHGRRPYYVDIRGLHRVSIHAPLTGGDLIVVLYNPPSHVSIHAPLTGGDLRTVARGWLRGGFNPRPPHGRRPEKSSDDGANNVSIHAPLTGGDTETEPMIHPSPVFQSTPPSREATRFSCLQLQCEGVSIHAPLTGGDLGG